MNKLYISCKKKKRCRPGNGEVIVNVGLRIYFKEGFQDRLHCWGESEQNDGKVELDMKIFSGRKNN